MMMSAEFTYLRKGSNGGVPKSKAFLEQLNNLSFQGRMSSV
jgi:hypothetical protein